MFHHLKVPNFLSQIGFDWSVPEEELIAQAGLASHPNFHGKKTVNLCFQPLFTGQSGRLSFYPSNTYSQNEWTPQLPPLRLNSKFSQFECSVGEEQQRANHDFALDRLTEFFGPPRKTYLLDKNGLFKRWDDWSIDGYKVFIFSSSQATEKETHIEFSNLTTPQLPTTLSQTIQSPSSMIKDMERYFYDIDLLREMGVKDDRRFSFIHAPDTQPFLPPDKVRIWKDQRTYGISGASKSKVFICPYSLEIEEQQAKEWPARLLSINLPNPFSAQKEQISIVLFSEFMCLSNHLSNLARELSELWSLPLIIVN